ncbi:dihydrofolate reductase [Rhizobium sp. RU36D]|uniref:dihydrofolate reductase n=1 Tax=Rhizobium sp. RU36D TaxID=1907415 RepID=UPI0009D8AF9C|nr:dihydrofolate reductase [Rhizobium sp. RU36D]SMC57484.1 dihydrofolate reductase [Rhizobium sp. RU36D]
MTGAQDAKIILVVAVAENGVIGRDGDMPWKLSTDLKRFKALTMGKPLVMGRKTFASIGERPLPGRPHVIITRDTNYRPEGVEVAHSLEAALTRAKTLANEMGSDTVCIVGGGEIYRQAMPLADELHVTHVEAVIEGDTHFPQIDKAAFEKVDEIAVTAGEKDSHPTRYAVYRRLRR